MPSYDYRCSHCSHQFEASQKMTAAPLVECPECKQLSLIRGPGGGLGLHFKGSGFYVTDYDPAQKVNANPCCPCGKSSCESK